MLPNNEGDDGSQEQKSPIPPDEECDDGSQDANQTDMPLEQDKGEVILAGSIRRIPVRRA